MKSITRAIWAAATPIWRAISAAGASGSMIRRRWARRFCARGGRRRRAGRVCSSSSPTPRRRFRSATDDRGRRSVRGGGTPARGRVAAAQGGCGSCGRSEGGGRQAVGETRGGWAPAARLAAVSGISGDLQLVGRVRRHYRLLVADQRLSRADRCGSLGGQWRGVSARADRSRETGVRGGVTDTDAVHVLGTVGKK